MLRANPLLQKANTRRWHHIAGAWGFFGGLYAFPFLFRFFHHQEKPNEGCYRIPPPPGDGSFSKYLKSFSVFFFTLLVQSGQVRRFSQVQQG